MFKPLSPRAGEVFVGSQKALASISSGNKWASFPVEKALEIAARNNQKPSTNSVDYKGPNPVIRQSAPAPQHVPSAEALKQLMHNVIPNSGPSSPANRS